MSAPDGFQVSIKAPTRSIEQNALLWPLLAAVSAQVVWYGKKLTSDDWKSVFTASLFKSEVVPGLDGGFVVIGQSTSKYTVSQFSDLLEIIYAFSMRSRTSSCQRPHEKLSVLHEAQRYSRGKSAHGKGRRTWLPALHLLRVRRNASRDTPLPH